MPDTVACSRCGTPVTVEGESLPAFCPACGAQLEEAQVVHELNAHVDYTLIAPPGDSKIEIIEATNDRLMLSIPAGGKKANALACFGVVWLIITGAFTTAFIFAALNDAGFDKELWVPLVVLSAFWLVGILMLVSAIRMKFSRGYLFLSRERAVHQNILFHRKKNKEIALDAASYAQLVESYQENDVPVYHIEIDGTDGKIKYGTGMNPEHKVWYVDTINHFIAFQYSSSESPVAAASRQNEFGDSIPVPRCPACGQVIPEGESTRCPSCGATLEFSGDEVAAYILEETEPESLPQGFPLKVHHSARGDWELTYSIRDTFPNLQGLGCLIAFGTLWEALIIAFSCGIFIVPGDIDAFMLLFTIPMHAIGLLPLGAGLFVLFGSFRLKLGTSQSSAFWGIGPLGYTRRFSTSSITEVKLIHGDALLRFKKTGQQRTPTSRSEGISCILMAAGKQIPVTSAMKKDESRTAAGLIRYCLHDLGHRLLDD